MLLIYITLLNFLSCLHFFLSKHLANCIVLDSEKGKTLHANSQRYMVYYNKWHVVSQNYKQFLLLYSGPLLCFPIDTYETIFTMICLDVVKRMYKGNEVNLYVNKISLDLISYLVYLITSYSIMLTIKHILGSYIFTNVSKHVFKIRMCLLHM